MIESKAKLSHLRVSPRKVRLVADLVRGRKIDDALAQLKFAEKKSAPIIAKLLKSAAANAKSNSKTTEESDLYVSEIRVDEGRVLKRWRPKWRGMAHQIMKRTSHISVKLSEKEK